MDMFNNNLCYSVKSKNCLTEQCTNKRLPDNNLCGRHLNCKNIIYFIDTVTVDTLINDTLINDTHINDTHINVNENLSEKIDTQIVSHLNIHQNTNKKDEQYNKEQDNKYQKDEKEDKNEKDNKIIYTKDELFEVVQKNKYISVYSLRKSIKNCYLNQFINTKLTKCNLIDAIKSNIQKERFYMNNVYYIQLIQKAYRSWQSNKRACCFNDTDILTFDSIYEIPNKYFYIFHDKHTNKKYGYDIRTLIEILYSDNPSCPYTFRQFTDEEKNKIYEYKIYLEWKNIDLTIEKVKMSEQEETDMKIKDVFYKINMLDNYTNPQWFKNLTLPQLIDLYVRLEDIWCYRTAMPMEARRNILYNGIAFNAPLYIIKLQKSLLKMQNIILDEFLRFVTEGINRDEKKLGAILILSGLVEVSLEAAEALPHLVQII